MYLFRRTSYKNANKSLPINRIRTQEQIPNPIIYQDGKVVCENNEQSFNSVSGTKNVENIKNNDKTDTDINPKYV